MRGLQRLWLGFAVTSVVFVPLSARAEDLPTAAQDAIKAISTEEAAHPMGRVTLQITERRGEYRDGEKLPETRERLATERSQSWDGTVLFRPDGWFKDLYLLTAGKRSGTHTRTVETAGLLRVLVETPRAEVTQRNGLVLRSSSGTPADIILTHRVGQTLAGITWASAKPEGDLLILEGKRGTERHTLLLQTGATPQIRNWTLVRHLEGPEGQSLDQRYVCEVTAGSTPGMPAQIEEAVINPPPSANVAMRITEIKKWEPLRQVEAETLHLVFPRGTVVTDTRGDAPIQYELTEDGLSDADITAAVQALGRGHARVGDAAPEWALPDTRGKTAKLGDYHGKVLVLFWFSTNSPASDGAAEAIQALAKKYGKNGTQFIAISAGDDGPGVDAYRNRFKWSFPVLLDPNAETLRRYGLETGVPKVAIIDRNGKIAYVRAGFDDEAIAAALEALK